MSEYRQRRLEKVVNDIYARTGIPDEPVATIPLSEVAKYGQTFMKQNSEALVALETL